MPIIESRSLKNPTKVQRSTGSFWRDSVFYIALAAGPVCWLVLTLVGLPVIGPPELLLWLKLSLLMPVLEEIVFRGGLQSGLVTRELFARSWSGISLANLLTSLIFAALHLFSQPPLWAALVFIPSLVFGWARDRYDSVVPCMILHATYNVGFVGLFVAPIEF